MLYAQRFRDKQGKIPQWCHRLDSHPSSNFQVVPKLTVRIRVVIDQISREQNYCMQRKITNRVKLTTIGIHTMAKLEKMFPNGDMIGICNYKRSLCIERKAF